MMTITHRLLMKAGAECPCCALQHFLDLWPDGAKVTKANALLAVEHFSVFDIDWIAEQLLSEGPLGWYCMERSAGRLLGMRNTALAFWQASRMKEEPHED